MFVARDCQISTYRDRRLVHGAILASKEYVHDDGHS